MNLRTARLMALEALAREDHDGALRACLQGLYSAPRATELYLIKGHVLLRADRPLEAVAAFEAALAASSGSTRIRCLLAAARDRAGDLEGAVADYRAVLVQEPLRVAARYNLALLLVAKEDVAGAVREYQELLRHEPLCVQAHNNLGVLLSAQGDADGAIACFERARRACPEDPVSALNLAREWADRGAYARAEEALALVLALSPEFGEALALAAWLHLRQGRWVEAERSYRLAAEAGFDTPAVQEGRAIAISSLS
ncbi:MAG TPA: tetratricopeptide repeat protein [Pantanalinema sp.]